MRHTREMATLRRSFQLLRSFRFEQTHPEIFYGGLAEDTAALVENLGRDLGAQLFGGFFKSAFILAIISSDVISLSSIRIQPPQSHHQI